MTKRHFCGPFVIFTLYTLSAAADAPPPTPVSLEIWNETGAALECQVLAAHWYTLAGLALARAAHGTIALHAANRVLQTQAGLPIERIFCGFAGNAWLTRGDVELRQLAEGNNERVACRDAGGHVACAVTEPPTR